MERRTFYPKTRRVNDNQKTVVTEKLDGSNLAFYKYQDELFICQRNYIYTLTELLEAEKGKLGQKVYKGLNGWITDNGKDLLDKMYPNSAICGEWIGMGKISYDFDDNRFFMFAKANIDEDQNIRNIRYDLDLFKYPFIDQTIPKYISVVPEVAVCDTRLSVKDLDELYDNYSEQVSREVEGFIVNTNNEIKKYVRLKNGKSTEHIPGKE